MELIPLDREQSLEVAIPKNLTVLLVSVFLPSAELTLLVAVPEKPTLGTLHQIVRLLVAPVAGSNPVGEGSVSLNFVAELPHAVEGDGKDLHED